MLDHVGPRDVWWGWQVRWRHFQIVLTTIVSEECVPRDVNIDASRNGVLGLDRVVSAGLQGLDIDLVSSRKSGHNLLLLSLLELLLLRIVQVALEQD